MTDAELKAEIRETERRLEECTDGFTRMMIEDRLQSLRKSVGFHSLTMETPQQMFGRKMNELKNMTDKGV